MTINDFSELKSFLSAYFHEDWVAEVQEPDEMILRFLASAPSGKLIDDIVAQIRCYLDSGRDEVAMASGLWSELGCYYDPSSDGLSVRDWLTHIAGRLQGL